MVSTTPVAVVERGKRLGFLETLPPALASGSHGESSGGYGYPPVG
jgi:hypothetical protein